MLLIDDDKSLSILKKGYTFSSEKVEADWDWSIQMLKKLSEARKKQGTHLEASIEVQTYLSDDPPHDWVAFQWCWSIGRDWSQRPSELEGTIHEVAYIRYYAGVKDGISHTPAICLGFPGAQDRERVERAALATLGPPSRK